MFFTSSQELVRVTGIFIYRVKWYMSAVLFCGHNPEKKNLGFASVAVWQGKASLASFTN